MKKIILSILLVSSLVVCLGIFTACNANNDDKSSSTQSGTIDVVNENGSGNDFEGSNPSKIDKTQANIISANEFTYDEHGNYKISVSNNTDTFSFLDQIVVSDYSNWVLSLDEFGTHTIITKKLSLNVGDNVVFIIVSSGDGKTISTYKFIVRRKPIYNIVFNANGGTNVDAQEIEENCYAIEPITKRTGYSFTQWDFDFNSPIVESKTITAIWTPNTDTPYTVKHYLQNLTDNNYSLDATVIETGTTDTNATAKLKQYEHFTPENYTITGNIDGDGQAVLEVYYSRDLYNVNIIANQGVSLDKNYSGEYKYGYNIEPVQAIPHIGYNFTCWEKNTETVTTNNILNGFVVDKDVTFVANCVVLEEFKKFKFESDINNCIIKGLVEENLTEIIIPDAVTEIDNYSFQYCNNITSIYIGKNVKTIGIYAFFGCHDLINVTFGENVLEIGKAAFAGCNNLENFDLGNKIKSIGVSAFYQCEKIKSINIPTSVITIGDSAFSYCTALSNLTILDSSISLGDYAFYGCSALTNFDFGNKAVSIGKEVFGYCANLKTLIVPESIINIGESAFLCCYSLEKITVPFIGSTIEDHENGRILPLGYLFGSEDCVGCTKTQQTSYINSKPITSQYYIPNSLTEITVIGGGALTETFANCKNISIVNLGTGVTDIGFYAFNFCSALYEVNISGKISSIGYGAFQNCSSLTNIIIPDSVKTISSFAFFCCTELSELTIPDSVIEINNSAFYRCSSLSTITISQNVARIGKNAFKNCDNLKNIIFENKVDWLVSTDVDAENWNIITVEDSSANAINFTTNYADYYWKRNIN